MTHDRHTLLASAIVLVTGILWGIYWLPVRALGDMGLTGAWGTVAITLATVLLLLPFAVKHRRQLRRVHPVALISIALGGAAFTLYSVGFMYGRVAIIILLWFLSPVWSTLIGRYLMGWPTPRLRIVAIAVGLAGLFVMLGADGGMPLPQGIGEWMALAAGILWAFSTTGIRVKSNIEAMPSTFIFAVGAAVTALILAPLLEPLPSLALAETPPVVGLALLTGGLWWGLNLVGLMWATARLEPARVCILLMSEVLFGAVSAAVLAGEALHPAEVAGGVIVLVAGLLEVLPVRAKTSQTPGQ
ncbi:DMT family transporter [Marinobacter salinisoli]|uniref:DMT family transporter n=1 Tax=Marinobacter salinisoli TaxID=2769486 RepID=A0ABX7MUK9_9GAMM|nr:DMT family transporter [Marinobacter salinisoli]QSP95177.1 DMT family transporter [Marinobacter salinisoli]